MKWDYRMTRSENAVALLLKKRRKKKKKEVKEQMAPTRHGDWWGAERGMVLWKNAHFL